MDIFFKMILEKITWPSLNDTEDGDEDVSLEDLCRITSFLRDYIENGMLY